MSEESRYGLSQDRLPVLWTASVGCAWSGTMRGLLTAHLANGETRVAAECCTPQDAADMAVRLNLAGIGPDKIRNITARRELMELRSLADMLPGRDNKENWKKKLNWLLEQFLDETDGLDKDGDESVIVHT